jgi:hypothetical protein
LRAAWVFCCEPWASVGGDKQVWVWAAGSILMCGSSLCVGRGVLLVRVNAGLESSQHGLVLLKPGRYECATRRYRCYLQDATSVRPQFHPEHRLVASPGCIAWLHRLVASPGCIAWLHRLVAYASRPVLWVLDCTRGCPRTCMRLRSSTRSHGATVCAAACATASATARGRV